MAKNFVMYSEDIDFSAKNFRKLAFRFNNSNCWMSFFENFSTYNCRVDACKLGKFYDAAYVMFKYCDEIKDEEIIDVLNNRGFCSTDLYVFRKTIVNENGIRVRTYYNQSEIFEKRDRRKCY